jgi:uncharacterized protein
MTQVSQEGKTVILPSLESNLQPLDKHKRIDALDILRGLALVGILLMNVEWFNRAMTSLGTNDTTLAGVDHTIGWLIRCFVEGKFYKLFALIFGMGFAVMLLRAKQAGRPFGTWFTRRMLVLWLIGLAHMIFLWGGDILHDYALAGFILLAWVTYKKTDNPRAYLKLALTWLMVPIFLVSFGGVIFGMVFNDAKYQDMWQTELAVFTAVEQQLVNDEDGSFIDVGEKNQEGTTEDALLVPRKLSLILCNSEKIYKQMLLKKPLPSRKTVIGQPQNIVWVLQLL